MHPLFRTSFLVCTTIFLMFLFLSFFFFLFFFFSYYAFQLTTHELKEGGDDIPVLEENKREYIDLMVKWRLDRGTQEQSNALMKGFNEIMPVSLIQQFDAQEVEFIIAGTLEIDIDDWRNNSDYRNGTASFLKIYLDFYLI